MDGILITLIVSVAVMFLIMNMTARSYNRVRSVARKISNWLGKAGGTGRSSKHYFPADFQVDGTNAPTEGTIGTDGQAKAATLDFTGKYTQAKFAFLNMQIPYDYYGKPRLLLYGQLNALTGSMSWKGTVNKSTPRDTNQETAKQGTGALFDVAGTAFTEVNPNAPSAKNEICWIDIDLEAAFDSEDVGVDDLVTIMIDRDPADAADDISDSFRMIGAVFEYDRG